MVQFRDGAAKAMLNESSSWGFPGPPGPGHIAERPLAAAGRLGDPGAPGRRSPRRKPTESVARPGAPLDFHPVQAVKTAAGSGVARLLVPQGPQDGARGRAQAPWGCPPAHVAHRGPGAWNPTLEPWNQPARQSFGAPGAELQPPALDAARDVLAGYVWPRPVRSGRRAEL